MSALTTTMIAIGMTAGGVGTVAAAKIGSNAANKAGQLQQASADQALEFEKGRDARDYAQYQKEYERQTRLQDEDRSIEMGRFNAREGRLAPYRSFGEAGLGTLKPLLKGGPPGTSPLAPRQPSPTRH